jgi:hypothetical protein
MAMKTLATTLLFAAGCTSNITDGSFHVSGRVQGTPTHVIAASHGAKTVVAQVASDGSFALQLAPKHAWAVGFVDARAKIVGTLASGTLDTLSPQGEGEIDLGTVKFALGLGTASVNRADLLAAMGLDEASAARIGEADDLATRLVTPDADGDGTIDALQPGHDYRLDLYGDVTLTIGNRGISVDDLVSAAPPVYGIAYGGTGIEVTLPPSFAMSEMTGAMMMFDESFYGSSRGDVTPMTPPDAPVTQPELLSGKVDGHPVAAVYARPGFDVPSGTYRFVARPTALTFEDVRAPSNAALAAGTGFVVPFVRVVPTVAGCQYDCTIDSIEYRWMARTATGAWEDAAPEMLALMPAARVDFVRIAPSGANQDMRIELSTSSQTGVLSWVESASHDGMLQSDLATVSTAQLCYVGAVFHDLVGTRLTSSATNPAQACASYR